MHLLYMYVVISAYMYVKWKFWLFSLDIIPFLKVVRDSTVN